MSGGTFDHRQYMLEDFASTIEERLFANAGSAWPYPPDIVAKFKETAHACRRCREMLDRVDWLEAGDDGTESFRERWAKEVRDAFQLCALTPAVTHGAKEKKPMGKKNATDANLLDNIMDVIKNTPEKLVTYECHGELHIYSQTDYEAIRMKISSLLSNKNHGGSHDQATGADRQHG